MGIIGDVRNSRVARSHLWGMPGLGVEITLIGPRSLLEQPISWGADTTPTSMRFWGDSTSCTCSGCRRRGEREARSPGWPGLQPGTASPRAVWSRLNREPSSCTGADQPWCRVNLCSFLFRRRRCMYTRRLACAPRQDGTPGGASGGSPTSRRGEVDRTTRRSSLRTSATSTRDRARRRWFSNRLTGTSAPTTPTNSPRPAPVRSASASSGLCRARRRRDRRRAVAPVRLGTSNHSVDV